MKKAAIYVRVSTPDQHVETSVVRSSRVCGTKRLRGCPRIRRSRCLWKEGTPSGA